MKNEVVIFLDLDGVIHAPMPLSKYEEPTVFSEVELLHEDTINFITLLRKQGNVKALSKTFYPMEHPYHYQQEKDKTRKCLALGFKMEDIIIMPSDSDKAIFSQVAHILIDDYGQNCQKWQTGGGIAIQYNEHKNKGWVTARCYNEVLHKVKMLRRHFDE